MEARLVMGGLSPVAARRASVAAYPWTSVLITGASSGLGRALAEASAAPGVTLHLSGRDAARIEEAAAACRERGAKAIPAVLDVTDAAAMADWIAGAGRLDLVIANAGISGGTGGPTW
jgi:NADP-dependent 3-hydroxy acid dehydrogenase YdfG